MYPDDIFRPVATDAPSAMFDARSDHPAPRLGIVGQGSPIGTNKFYANFFLGSQTAATWTHPYSVAWSKGGGTSRSWGMSVSHIDESQKVFGPDPNASTAQYFINPIGIQSLVLSALELGASTSISMDSITAFSANVNILPNTGAPAAITFPLVQGMAFVTAIYHGTTPILETGVFFRSLFKANSSVRGVTKYVINLEDGKTWLLYAYSAAGDSFDLSLTSNCLAKSSAGFNGTVQIAKLPVGSPQGGDAETLYDRGCGVYPTSVKLSGEADGSRGSYTLTFDKAGITAILLTMFALPHHVESFSQHTVHYLSRVRLNTTTKGMATAVVGDSWTFAEFLPITMSFVPWNNSSPYRYITSDAAASVVYTAAESELLQDMTQQTNLDSMYFSGKALAKFAGIVYTMHDLLDSAEAAEAGLKNLQTAFAIFARNEQKFPLVHDTAWGGIVSSASYVTGDPGADFGNSYYNDHHFHYGYFIYTAAVIGHLDPSWIPENKSFVNTLVRDIANPSTQDPYFPVSRNFDWYHGHSWAHGLYESSDGKDQESSSEDAMSAYALKMWGYVIGDRNMEGRGNLQLAVTTRAIQKYYLYESNNTTVPAKIIGNKVAGILFENKIDHTTYFGANIEYIQGIHMLPLLPFTTLTRTKNYVTEEWNAFFSNGRVDSIPGGWRGILYANLAIIDPKAAWQFFSQPNFDMSLLDGGASLTWYLVFAAMLGGAPES